jgi:hypothetical protein
MTLINPERYKQLITKLDVQDMKPSSDGSRPEKKLPTIDELRKTTEEKQYELKVKEFYLGKQETSASASTIILPPVDAYSQQTIRLSIVSEKVMTWFVLVFFCY